MDTKQVFVMTAKLMVTIVQWQNKMSGLVQIFISIPIGFKQIALFFAPEQSLS